jgi:hypothetical protein
MKTPVEDVQKVRTDKLALLRNGKVSRVLTMEENKQQIESLKAKAAQRRN